MPIRRIAVAGALLAALAVPSIVFAQARMKVLLDTDIGTDIDDAWALGLLIASPNVDLVGVTITDGDTAARAKVACKLLHVTGRDEVPVAVGRRTALPNGVTTSSPAEEFTASSPSRSPPPTSSSIRCARIPGNHAHRRTAAERRRRNQKGTDPRMLAAGRADGGSIGGAWSPSPT
jgi:hypothetical protein